MNANSFYKRRDAGDRTYHLAFHRRTPDERTPTDGRPYYCQDCGLGFGEFLACDLDCRLESEATARARQAEARKRKKPR